MQLLGAISYDHHFQSLAAFSNDFAGQKLAVKIANSELVAKDAMIT